MKYIILAISFIWSTLSTNLLLTFPPSLLFCLSFSVFQSLFNNTSHVTSVFFYVPSDYLRLFHRISPCPWWLTSFSCFPSSFNLLSYSLSSVSYKVFSLPLLLFSLPLLSSSSLTLSPSSFLFPSSLILYFFSLLLFSLPFSLSGWVVRYACMSLERWSSRVRVPGLARRWTSQP